MEAVRKLFRKRTSQETNYNCILLEGLFNTLGTDILGITTIVPLFLAEFGASLTLIGSLSTAQSVISAVVPLLAGGFIACAASKRRLSLLLNGISRGSILLIPILLLLRAADTAVIFVFFGILLIYFAFQSMTGIIWNHLLGDCVEASRRAKLVGTLFSISGFITFASSNIVKAIRDNPSLDRWNKYAIIFGLAGILVAVSVLCFIPLKEETQGAGSREKQDLRSYILELLRCFKNRDFDKMLVTNCFAQSSTMINAFVYLYAQNFLMLPAEQVSTLLVLQTLGVIAGGFLSGRISARFGSRRMLVLVESLGILVPVINLAAMRVSAPFYLMCAAVFVMGFSKSGHMGYQTHLLEIVAPEKKIYHIVTKSLVLLPISLVSTFVGYLLQQFSGMPVSAVQPVYMAQVVLAVLAAVSASRLKLIVYNKK